MKTMKKFWKYFLCFVALMLFVTGITYWGRKIINNETDNNTKNVLYNNINNK